MKGDVWFADVQSVSTSIAKCFLQTLTFGFQIPRHSKFSINVHTLLSGNPLPADISTDLVVGLLEVLYSLLVFLEITLMFQHIWKRQPGFNKGISFPFSMCCSMCCKAPGDSFFMAVYLPVLGWGSWPWGCDKECRNCHLRVTFLISDKCVEGQGKARFRHRAKTV